MQSKATTRRFPLAAQVARATHRLFCSSSRANNFCRDEGEAIFPVAFHEDEAKIGGSDTTSDGDFWFAARGIMKLSEGSNEASIDLSSQEGRQNNEEL